MYRVVLLLSLGMPLLASATPSAKHHSKVFLGDSIVRLVQEGVLDPQKVEALYARRGGVPAALKQMMAQPSYRRIELSRENANAYLVALWPLGLANRMAANSQSPLNGPQLFGFASTGGWNLGKAANGGVYFNKFGIVELTPVREALVVTVASRSFRPCCGNSAFFQDCNHGSALLGLLALGASQGLTEDELYREAFAFNTFWFPDHYGYSALYFKAVRGIGWRGVDPREAMSAAYSSARGWQTNVAQELRRRGLVPQGSGVSCDV